MKTYVSRRMIEIGAYVLASLILYHLNILLFLFLVPLQVLYERRGEQAFTEATVVFAVAIAVIRLLRITLSDITQAEGVILGLDLIIPLLLIGGLYAVNILWNYFGRKLFTMYAAALIAASIAIPVGIFISRRPDIIEYFLEYTKQITAVMRDSLGSEDITGTSLGIFLEPKQMIAFIREIISATFVFLYFFLLSAGWWIGHEIGVHTSKQHYKSLPAERFFLPENMIWVFLLSWTAIFIDITIGIGFLKYAAWNIGLIQLFLYFIQGMGIINHYLEKRKAVKRHRILFYVIVGIFLLWPGINLAILIGIPGLGISEIWIAHRKVDNNKEKGDNSL